MDEAIICDFLQRDLLPVSQLRLPGRGVAILSITQCGSMPLLAALTSTHVHVLSLWTGKPLHRSHNRGGNLFWFLNCAILTSEKLLLHEL